MALVLNSVELRDIITARRWFDLPMGMTGQLSTRGVDVTIPGLSGQYPRDRIAHQRIVPIHGFVLGTSEANHLAERDALEAVFDPTDAPMNLVVTGDWIGLGATTRTLVVRVMDDVRIVERVPNLVTEYDVQLLCIATPPNWT